MRSFEDRYGFSDPLGDQFDEAPRSAKPKLSKADQEAKRAAKRRSEGSQMGGATKRRQRWEASPEGQARLSGVEEWHAGEHRRIAEAHPHLGLDPEGGRNPNKAHLYERLGFTEHAGPVHHERQLPGMENPGASPQQERWEDLSGKRQARVLRSVRLKTGATPETMQRAFGTQLDQAYLRARSAGHDAPYSQDFYTHGEPARVIHRTAQEHGVSPGLVAAMHADNSPNTPFAVRDEGGALRYPQDEMTRAALTHVQAGGESWSVPRPERGQGYDANLVKSAERARQHLHEGRPVHATDPSTAGYGMGPKTQAYHNSWLPDTPDFFVSDVHSGGGGMVPHLGTAKKARQDRETGAPLTYRSMRYGKEVDLPKREKSEREKAVEIPGFHQLADYAARRALAERGLGRVRQAQASQWGEERLQRPDVPISHERAYPSRGGHEDVVNENQMRLL